MEKERICDTKTARDTDGEVGKKKKKKKEKRKKGKEKERRGLKIRQMRKKTRVKKSSSPGCVKIHAGHL